jgi:hypothetical protein
MDDLDDVMDAQRHKRLWELYDEIVMLLATDLGLNIDALTRPTIKTGEVLLNDLIAQASPITNPRVLQLLKEYDALGKPIWDYIKHSLETDSTK